jgi:hypothetical protein
MKFKGYVSISDPTLYNSRAEYQVSNSILDSKNCDELIVGTRNYRGIKFSSNDIFCFKDEKLLYTIQRLSPLMKKMKIDYYYKY